MALLGIILMSLFVSCGDGDSGKRDNPFDSGDDFILVSQSSNADTLFLSWTLADKTLHFDNYRVEMSGTGTVKTLGREETSCMLTHLPYDSPVSVTFSALDGEKSVASYKFDTKIDGLDRKIASVVIPDYGSVTGGDGMYSIPLPDGRSIFLMGDSYTSPVTGGQRSTSSHMYRNTYILYDDGHVSAICDANGDKTSAAVPPGVTDEHKKWYWPGHGFVVGDRLFIFQTLMYQGASGMWGFMYETTHILEYRLPGMELVKTAPIPFSGSADTHYGMAALNDGNYLYIYAQVDITNDANPITEVLVARTIVDDIYDSWEYYTGSGWSGNSSSAAKLPGLSAVAVSSQFNVFKLRGKYVLLTQKKNFNSGEIYTFVSDTPCGPWKNQKLIFRTYEQKTRGLFTYNAMAHPQFERDGMILVSYNVNTEDFSQQFSDVSTYRPRFFWIPVDEILNN